MVFDIGNNFSKLNKALRTQEKVETSIRNRSEKITEIINEVYWTSISKSKHSLFVGSYGRGTAIKVSDVDLLVVLPDRENERFEQYQDNGQSALLQDVKDKLKHHYSRSTIKGDGQIVSINFHDGISFEILPAFKKESHGYRYSDTHNGGTWKYTNPEEDQKILTCTNKEYNLMVKRTARIIRSWRSTNDVKISGIEVDSVLNTFFLEKILNTVSFSDLDKVINDFFKWLVNKLENKVILYSLDRSFPLELNSDIKSKLKTAVKRADKALNFQEQGKYSEAEDEWIKIFGDDFPHLYMENKNIHYNSSTNKSLIALSTRQNRSGIGTAKDTEKFADEEWKISPNCKNVEIKAELSMKGFRPKDLTFLDKFKIRRDAKIIFSIKSVEKVKWYWKIRNVGHAAIEKDDIRGNIVKGDLIRKETINFSGPHYVEVYGIVDNVVCYAGHINVPLHS